MLNQPSRTGHEDQQLLSTADASHARVSHTHHRNILATQYPPSPPPPVARRHIAIAELLAPLPRPLPVNPAQRTGGRDLDPQRKDKATARRFAPYSGVDRPPQQHMLVPHSHLPLQGPCHPQEALDLAQPERSQGACTSKPDWRLVNRMQKWRTLTLQGMSLSL